MFSEDYKRGVCLDDLDVGLDWNALFKALRSGFRDFIIKYIIEDL